MKQGNMWFPVLLGVLLTAGCSQEVQTGRIVMCKECGKETENTVSVVSVPVWKADQYEVKREGGYCLGCGSEKVAYRIRRRCEQCGKIYHSQTAHAERRKEQRNRTVTDGYCCERCRRLARIDSAIDKASEKTGDVLGRIGRGIADGIMRHTR